MATSSTVPGSMTGTSNVQADTVAATGPGAPPALLQSGGAVSGPFTLTHRNDFDLDSFSRPTDDQKMAAALVAVTAAKGGAIRLGARTHTLTSQLVTHFTSQTPVSISITGCGGSNQGVDLNIPSGATTLDISGIPGPLAAKVLFKHAGYIELAGLVLKDASVQSPAIPMVQVTNPRPDFHHLAVQGNNTGNPTFSTSSPQDVFHFGGTGLTLGTDNDQGAFHGYAASVRNVSFNGIRRGIWARSYANDVTMRDCYYSVDCGSGLAFSVTDAAIMTGTNTLTTAASTPFTASMAGQPVVITGAGNAYTNAGYLVSYITAVNSTQSVTLNDNAAVTVTGAKAVGPAGAAMTFGMLGGGECQGCRVSDSTIESCNYAVSAEIMSSGQNTIRNCGFWDTTSFTLFGMICYGTSPWFNLLELYGADAFSAAPPLLDDGLQRNTCVRISGSDYYWVSNGARFGPAVAQVEVGTAGTSDGYVWALGTDATVNLNLAATGAGAIKTRAHISSVSPAGATITAGAAAGTSPVVSVSGTDQRGTITITTGTSPAAGILATVTFGQAWGQTGTPLVMVTADGATAAASQAAAALQPSTLARTTTSFQLACNGTPQASTTYTYSYLAMG